MLARKGLVVEKGQGWAIILLPDGEFKRIRTTRYLEVGEQYQETNLLPVKYIAAAVILLALVLTSIDYYSVKAYAQVASLAELGVNRWGRVISVKATDDNGKLILSAVEVNNDELEVAVEKIYSQVLKEKQNDISSLEKPLLSIESIKYTQPGLEEKMLKKMDRGLQKAVQTQKQADKTKATNKNKTMQPEDNIKEATPAYENQVLPSANLNQGNQEKNQKKKIENHEDQIDSVDSKIKNQRDEIDAANRRKNIHSKQDSDSANNINKLKLKDNHSDKIDE